MVRCFHVFSSGALSVFTLVAELRALFYPTGVTDGEAVWENCECSVPGKVKW